MEELIKELKEKEHYKPVVDEWTEDIQKVKDSNVVEEEIFPEGTLDQDDKVNEDDVDQELDLDAEMEQKETSQSEDPAPGVPTEDDNISYILRRMENEYPTIFKGYQHVCDEQFLLFMRKHLDYGMENITAGTSLETVGDANFALQGIWYRLSDKVNRWKNIMKNGGISYNESVLDSLQDIANYAIIAQLVARGLWKKG